MAHYRGGSCLLLVQLCRGCLLEACKRSSPGQGRPEQAGLRRLTGYCENPLKKRLRVHFIFAYFGLSYSVFVRCISEHTSKPAPNNLLSKLYFILMCKYKGTGKHSSDWNGQKNLAHDFPKSFTNASLKYAFESSVHLENTFKSHKRTHYNLNSILLPCFSFNWLFFILSSVPHA